MNKLRPLLLLELRALFGINRALHTKDKKAKNRYIGLGFVWLLLIVMVAAYVGGLVFGLCRLGLSAIVPAYLAFVSSALILMVGLFSAGKQIFGQKGYDSLASMPVSAAEIVCSRFLALYLSDLLFALLVMLPGIAVYGILVQPHIGFYLMALVGTICIPAIPLVISVLFGTLVLAIASRMKHKNLMQSVLMIVFVLAILALSFAFDGAAGNFTAEQFTELATLIGGTIEKNYPPAMWLNEGMVLGRVWPFLLFVSVSVLVMALTVFIVAKRFHRIIHRLQGISARHDYKITATPSRSLLRSLFIREAKQYFSSSIYVTNTVIGPILGALVAILLSVAGVDSIKEVIPMSFDVEAILPFVLSAVFGIMPVTFVSVSMEGKHIWVLKSLPIPAKTWLDSKILFNLALLSPFYLVSVVALGIATKPNLMELVWLLVLPASVLLFVFVLGLTVNLKFHSFDWERAEVVVKQSFPAMIGTFAGLLVTLLFGGLTLATPAPYGDLTKLLGCVLLWGITAFLYRKNNRTNMARL